MHGMLLSNEQALHPLQLALYPFEQMSEYTQAQIGWV